MLGDKALEAPAAVTPKAGIDGLRYAMIAMLGMWFLLRRDLAGRYTGRG